MGLGAWLRRLLGSRRCPSCRGELVALEPGLRGRVCRNCHRYYPPSAERSEIRAMFQKWRRLLLVVADLHKLGYECARIVPFIVDTPGGGDWTCIIAPSAMISPSHGATIAEHPDWVDFPYFIGRTVRSLPGLPQGFDSAKNMILAYPKLAEQCIGPDREYAEWYRAMLRTTEPEGVVYGAADLDDQKNPPINGMRVLGPEGHLEILVPLPPPGAAPTVSPSLGGGEQVAQ